MESLGSTLSFAYCIPFAGMLLSIAIYRPFCKYLCPLGAIYGLFNRVALLRYRVDQERCTQCGACQRACQMGVDITKGMHLSECIFCGDCKAACKAGAISFGAARGKKAGDAINFKKDAGI